MSYDICLKVDAGGANPIEPEGFYWNYTSNCAPMWRKAMPETDGLAGFHDKQANEVIPTLRRGIEHMQAHAPDYRAMNPDNGWGDFDSQLTRLKYLLTWLERVPTAKIEIWR